MQIVLYRSVTCPKCKVLETKLKAKGIAFEECTDTTKMREMGLTSVPWLQVDNGPLMDMRAANEWINKFEVRAQ